MHRVAVVLGVLLLAASCATLDLETDQTRAPLPRSDFTGVWEGTGPWWYGRLVLREDGTGAWASMTPGDKTDLPDIWAITSWHTTPSGIRLTVRDMAASGQPDDTAVFEGGCFAGVLHLSGPEPDWPKGLNAHFVRKSDIQECSEILNATIDEVSNEPKPTIQ